MRFLLGHKRTRIWFAVTSLLLVLVLVVNILANTLFYDVFCSVFGSKRAVYAEDSTQRYTTEYSGKEDVLAAANEFNEKIGEEGFILLKNENNALPIYTPMTEGDHQQTVSPKVSVFGKNSVNIAIGGSGSSGSGGTETVSLYDGLTAAGYVLNMTLYNFYNSEASGQTRPASPEGSNLDDGKSITIPTYETSQSAYTDEVKSSYAEYSDAAFIVITRMGGEGFDLPRTMEGVSGARQDDDHYLQLDQNETDLIRAVCNAGFKKVILLINAGTTMELGFLQSSTADVYNELKGYDIDADKIDAAMWIGFPGASGMNALGNVLCGNVNPSGRTVDTWAMDFKADPTWNNIGDNLTAGGDQYTVNGVAQEYYFVDYQEGIYVGYRYYETRGVTDGEDWYKSNVVYPFGYGLSYTTFEWELMDDSEIRNVHIQEGDVYTIQVKVTNSGDVKGKDVVQLYGHAPYEDFSFGLQKPEEVLVAFAKTSELDPGESEIVTLEFAPYYLASYDYLDENSNGISSYELEPGEYALYVSRNAHEKAFEIPFTVDNVGTEDTAIGIAYVYDPVTGNKVENRYTGLENSYYNSDFHLTSKLNRDSWNEWTTSGAENRELGQDDALIAVLKDTNVENLPDMPTYDDEVEVPFGKTVTLTLQDLLADADDNASYPAVAYDDVRWETILEECTVSDLMNMRDFAAFKSGAIEQISKPLTNDTDGPAGFVNFMLNDGTYYDTCYYASQMLVASTWNVELAEEFGEMVGDEAIIGADGQGNGMPYSGWYAPGANIHRSPFGGRNFEYMGEDGVLTGKMAAAQIRGCQSKGVYTFMKHFALNDQETHRSSNGVGVWVTEQAMREVYLRPFEIAVKESNMSGIMSSFNRIGAVWAGGDYRLLTEILRDEWGFKGTVISDFTSGSYMNSKQMAYAGGDLNLNNQDQYKWADFDVKSIADVAALRKTAKNILYTVVNSNAMSGEIAGYKLAVWQVLLFVFDGVLVFLLMLWGTLAIRRVKREIKKDQQHTAVHMANS